jgi:hypothetical protein
LIKAGIIIQSQTGLQIGEVLSIRSGCLHQPFVRQLILKHIPIAYVMKQFSHVSIEITCHYLSLQEKEIKDIYSHLILNPDAKIAGINAKEIKLHKALKLVQKDFSPDEINLYQNVTGFKDFDLSEVNVRLWDPCYFETGILSETENDDEKYGKWLGILKVILQGYNSINPHSTVFYRLSFVRSPMLQ